MEFQQLVPDIYTLSFGVFVQSLFVSGAKLGIWVTRLASALLQLMQTPAIARYIFLVLRVYGTHLPVGGILGEQWRNEKLGKSVKKSYNVFL